MNKGTQVRLSHDRLCELGRMYRELVTSYEPVDDHMELLYCHMKDFHHKLKMLAVKEQEDYRLRIADTEGVAFRQIWTNPEVYIPDANEWSAQITRSMVAAIDKNLQGLKGRKWTV